MCYVASITYACDCTLAVPTADPVRCPLALYRGRECPDFQTEPHLQSSRTSVELCVRCEDVRVGNGGGDRGRSGSRGGSGSRSGSAAAEGMRRLRKKKSSLLDLKAMLGGRGV